MPLQVTVINPDQVVFEGEVDYILAPTPKGTVGILPNHTPMFAELRPGEVILHGKENTTYTIEAGLLKVRADVVTILIGL
jgi:F-type H+-transporting ATPase subunit epsilon